MSKKQSLVEFTPGHKVLFDALIQFILYFDSYDIN